MTEINLTNVEGICDAILEYNLLIYTNDFGTINTEQFNLVDCTNDVGICSNVLDVSQECGAVILGYNPNGTQKIGYNELKKDEGYRTIVIPFNTITKIQIEGRRNHLYQNPIVKVGKSADRIEQLENKLTPKLFHDSDRKAGKLDIPTNDGTICYEWHEITEDWGVGAHNNSVQIDLEGQMKEIYSVQITPSTSTGHDIWDLPTFQFALIDSNQLRIQIMASKGGIHTIHLLVIGKK